MSKIVVFLAIPNHTAASDLLRTDYLQCLAAEYRVVVLSPFIDGASASPQRYFSSPDVEYIRYGLRNPRFWGFFKFLRICWVNEFDYLTSIRHWYQRPNYKGNWLRRWTRAMGKPFYKFLTADFFTAAESRLLPDSQEFSGLIVRYRPSLVITSTPGFDPWEAEVILLSRRSGIATVAVNFSWDNLTTNAKHIRKTDYLIAWNGIMKKEAEQIHRYVADAVFVSGIPRFDPYFWGSANELSRGEFLKSKGLNPQYKTIFHTTVTKAYPFQKKYVRDLIELRLSGRIPYVNLFIRIHPLDIYENYREFLDVPDMCVEPAVRSGVLAGEMDYADLLNLKCSLKYTDLNINYASTISIEACVFDKPIINIGWLDRFKLAYEFNHYRPVFESGAVKLAKTDADLAKLINMYLENPIADKAARQKVVREFVEFTDGLSCKRSVDILGKILS